MDWEALAQHDPLDETCTHIDKKANNLDVNVCINDTLL